MWTSFLVRCGNCGHIRQYGCVVPERGSGSAKYRIFQVCPECDEFRNRTVQVHTLRHCAAERKQVTI